MLPLRPFSRRLPRIRPQILHPRPRIPLRLQHDSHGPHKEYFQHPSQYPTNLQPAPNTPSSYVPQPTIAQATAQADGPSPIRRGLRNAGLILVFSLLGYATGAAVITWEYVQPPYERGSEEYTELQEEVDEILEEAPICEHLRGRKWIEGPIVRASPPGTTVPRGDQHLVNDTLSGVQGFTTKHFRHPKLEISMLVFFSGFGIDGWPDTVHGGAISTIMLEARNKHLEPVMKEYNLRGLPHSQFDVAFTQKVKPGSVYAVLVSSHGWGTGYLEGRNEDFIVNNAVAFLCNPNEFEVEENVPHPQSGPDGGTTIDMKGEQYAIATLVTCMSSNKVEGESREEYSKRLDEITEQIADKTPGSYRR
ncbi:hypothetical protein LTR70_004897 [Exophiala xenobiotica]|uniref:Uncharacterized protein n=1 Tax=Lithohypha guttulata TaxID=1690604 RepID=A0ABR0KCS2_9EURO|nr:hypothetical protein LTR24_004570 [Lithohypha guttulata]KAK5319713.1 hypothetical protein LTR70_004897 [Exophiala xenobiotica]